MATLNINGGTIYYVKSSFKKDLQYPLLLIHGAGGTHLHWLYQVKGIDYPVIALDLPGHGRSDKSADNSIEKSASLILEFARRGYSEIDAFKDLDPHADEELGVGNR